MLCVIVICAASINTVYDAWKFSKIWEQTWIINDNHKSNPYSKFDVHLKGLALQDVDVLLSAIERADKESDSEALRVLIKHLKSNFKSTDETKVRFSDTEVIDILLNILFSVMFLVLPASANYIRHGKFRLWNRSG